MIVLTGAAGFIGFHTAKRLLASGKHVIGIDNVNDYYDVALKEARLKQLLDHDNFTFFKIDISDRDAVQTILDTHGDNITHIIHLAAQAGVRYSIENPYAYSQSNLTGHLVMLEAARNLPNLKHFVYASSSSVYGGNTQQPFSVDDHVRDPVSLYAATKRANELMTQSYAHLYNIPSTGLRFFTVYGPWGRPDMALFSFTKSIIAGEPITVFNHGDMKRDFTYIDDCVDGILAASDAPPSPGGDYCLGNAPHRVFNLGHNEPEDLIVFIDTIAKAIGKPAEKIMAPMAAGDVKETYADINASKDAFGYQPTTPITIGIPKFVDWYKNFYKVA